MMEVEGLGMMMGGGLMMVLVWVVPIALVVWGLSSLRGVQRPLAQGETAAEILRWRYAGGEISREEFEQAKRDLA